MDAAIEWLCLNLDNSELPKAFAPAQPVVRNRAYFHLYSLSSIDLFYLLFIYLFYRKLRLLRQVALLISLIQLRLRGAKLLAHWLPMDLRILI